MSASGQKKVRNRIDYSTKVEIIREIEGGKRQLDIAKERNLPTSTVQDIFKNRDKILENFTKVAPAMKKVRLPSFPKTEEALSIWFDEKRARNVPISGPILIEKAKEFSQRFQEEDFKGSQGWLQNWKKRHNVAFSIISGEAGAVNDETVDTWLTKVWSVLKVGYAPEDIFNCDETGLFYKALPNKTFNKKGTPCTGGKLSKERVTVLLACNATGTEKLKPLVIGKSENPRCFKGIKKQSLPLDYKWNSKSWMTQDIFSEWLRKLDVRMRFKRRKIVMLLDNCAPHKVNLKLNNVKLIFFPPNVTAKLQPLDQGIINEVKKFYRSALVRSIIEKIDKREEYTVDILEAILKLNSAWISIKPSVIANCFTKARIIQAQQAEQPEVVELELDFSPDELASVDFAGATMEDYIHFDDNVATSYEPTEDDIVAAINSEEVIQEVNEESDGEEDAEVIREILPFSAAEDALAKLKLYTMQNDLESEEVFRSINLLENQILKSRLAKLRQPLISEFFGA